jgi:aryl-alcohol dehydrogenase-like predicted oxidoreductase
MRYRTLGKHGPKVSAVGYGCPTFTGKPSADYEAKAIRILHKAIDLGVTYIDAADHNEGNNEEILAKALKGRWKDVVVATKVGNRKSWPGSGRDADGRPETLTRLANDSLKRLGVDCVDLLYLHRVDPEVPIEESIGALKRLAEAGKAKHLGMSEAGAATLKRASAVHPIVALESEYSLWTRDYEADTLPAAKTLGIGVVPYNALGKGFFAGAVSADLGPKDGRRKLPRFQAGNLEKNLGLLERFRAVASAKGATVGQLALAWLIAQGEWIVPIPGTLNEAHLQENAGAAEITLTPKELEAIDTIFPRSGAVAGARFAEDRSKELNI